VAIQTDELVTIIALAQRNDQGAYEQLYSRFVDQLYRYLFVRCNDAELAEEVLGELWLRVVQHLPHFRIPVKGVDQAFISWLYRIARNLSVDALRYKGKHIYGIPEMIESPEPQAEDRVVAEDERRLLDKALTTLTVEQREVILLRFHDDRTISEVATLTGRTETAIKGLQHRAVGALARAMGVRSQKVTDANTI
jgi:RNA polymerase sigma-70 factor, ECF subfamily